MTRNSPPKTGGRNMAKKKETTVTIPAEKKKHRFLYQT